MSATTYENPLRAGLRLERTAEPCIIVILGASGDLTKRKLVPALYRLVQQRLIPAEFAIIGAARSEMSNEEFRDAMKAAIIEFSEDKHVDEKVWNSFAQSLYYVPLNIRSDADFKRLGDLLTQIDAEKHTQGNRLFYLSVAPSLYAEPIPSKSP